MALEAVCDGGPEGVRDMGGPTIEWGILTGRHCPHTVQFAADLESPQTSLGQRVPTAPFFTVSPHASPEPLSVNQTKKKTCALTLEKNLCFDS